MQQPQIRSMTTTEWVMLVTLSILWGGSFFFTGVAIKALPPFTLVALRVGLAALILQVVVRLLGVKLPTTRKVWAAFFWMGLLNNAVPFSLIVWGQTHIASGFAAILNATTPLWTVVVAHVLTKDERMTGNRLAGVLVGLVGVVVMVGPSVLSGVADAGFAQLAVLAASVSYAFAGVFGRNFKQMGIPPLATAAGQVSASTVMLFPVALLVDKPWMLSMPDVGVWAAVFAIAALSTALAYVLYFRILATAGATNVILVTFLVPISAIVLGSLVLGERLDPRQFLGMALIGVGLAAIDGRLSLRLAEAIRR